MKLLGKVAYKGTAYQGWQRQPDGPTVEEAIEKVLSTILNVETSICGSGRTDAGVHARGQYFHFEVKNDTNINKLRYSCNQLLPRDIHLVSLTEIDDSFHARFSAKEKHYSYTLFLGENDPFTNEFAYHFLRPLDAGLFISAIKAFEGTHPFQDFTSKEKDEKAFVRTVRIEVMEDENKIRIDFYGDGFMKYMIRFMVGTAIAIGEKRESITFISEHLQENKVREIVRYKAPSEGLVLEDVKY
ncbi:MAG TPA: tRNA pseudouridine(38-40) synthase TruA [Bacilli bacterium]|nr:tRNA pseudouridine(38-40) synthase TruA [Bacilli bacterium]